MPGPVDTSCRWPFDCQLPRTSGNTSSQVQPNFAWCLYISDNGRYTCGCWTAKQTLSHIDLTIQIIEIEKQCDFWARQCDRQLLLKSCAVYFRKWFSRSITFRYPCMQYDSKPERVSDCRTVCVATRDQLTDLSSWCHPIGGVFANCNLKNMYMCLDVQWLRFSR